MRGGVERKEIQTCTGNAVIILSYRIIWINKMQVSKIKQQDDSKWCLNGVIRVRSEFSIHKWRRRRTDYSFRPREQPTGLLRKHPRAGFCIPDEQRAWIVSGSNMVIPCSVLALTQNAPPAQNISSLWHHSWALPAVLHGFHTNAGEEHSRNHLARVFVGRRYAYSAEWWRSESTETIDWWRLRCIYSFLCKFIALYLAQLL